MAFERLKQWFAQPAKQEPQITGRIQRAGQDRKPRADSMNVRRWEAGISNRLNSQHWNRVTANHINTDLQNNLETVRARATAEIANNPFVDGVITTHITDLIGKDGPKLQVQSNDQAYNEALEAAWNKWAACPDINGALSLVDLLRLWLRSCWGSGEYLAQIVSSPEGPRLNNLRPQRLDTPWSQPDDVVLGIKLSKTGQPLRYYINEQEAAAFDTGTDYKALDPADVIHGFLPIEAEQVRGVLWIACALEAIADLRDYDTQVLDAARLAADFFILMFALDPNQDIDPNPDPVDVRRREITQLPSGWDAKEIDPKHPTTSYVEFRAERHREIGRAAGMPLMMIRSDSSDHNYSSARFDGQQYQRVLQSLRGWLERTLLKRLVDLVALEYVRLAGQTLAPPADLELVWTWAPMPHVDPDKEAKAAAKWYGLGATTLRDICAAQGRDWEEVLRQKAKEKELLDELGLSAEDVIDGEDDKDEDDEDKPEKSPDD